ncbi:MAG: hypothetical protein RI101_01590 [Nitrospira sp.]|jgi:hypothetical protein|nr:hypothetical protein [Nitrospira sp.]
MLIGSTIPKQLVVILSVWLLMTGMALLDVVDLSDEFAYPWVTWDQAIDPELEESDDEFSPVAVAAFLPAPLGGYVSVDSTVRAHSRGPLEARESRPLFQQLAQYRI